MGTIIINSTANWQLQLYYSLLLVQGRLHKAVYQVQWRYHKHPYIKRKQYENLIFSINDIAGECLPFCHKACHSQSLGISHSHFHHSLIVGITETSVAWLNNDNSYACVHIIIIIVYI